MGRETLLRLIRLRGRGLDDDADELEESLTRVGWETVVGLLDDLLTATDDDMVHAVAFVWNQLSNPEAPPAAEYKSRLAALIWCWRNQDARDEHDINIAWSVVSALFGQEYLSEWEPTDDSDVMSEYKFILARLSSRHR